MNGSMGGSMGEQIGGPGGGLDRLGAFGDGIGAGQRSWMPALVGVVLALLLWAVGEDQRDKLPPLQQQLKSATQVIARGGADQVAAVKAAAVDARAQRAAIESRLQSGESVQMTRARMVFDLRQKCAAALAKSCAVRLSDEAGGAATGATVTGAGAGVGAAAQPPPRTAAGGSAGPAAEATLEMLGVGKARGVVSGSFQGNELLALYESLVFDDQAPWRVNGVVVRGNTFELDVERHVRVAASANARQP